MALRSVSVAAWSVLAAAALAATGCKRSEEPGDAAAGKSATAQKPGAPAEGTLLAAGNAQDLRVSPDKQWAVYLVDAKKPALDGIPPQMRLGRARVVSTTPGSAEPRELGEGVSNVPGGMLFSADSRYLLYLTAFNPAGQAGDLNVLALGEQGAAPARVGRSVTYLLPSRDGSRLAFVEEGTLKLGPLPEGPFQAVATDVTTADFSPDGQWLFFKRKLSAGGGLEAVSVSKPEKPRTLGTQVGTYAVASDSKHVAFQARSKSNPSLFELHVAPLPSLAPVRVAEGTSRFSFSPDGKWLARTANGKTPDDAGVLVVGPASGASGRTVGERAENLSFSADSRTLAFLGKYSQEGGMGTLTVVGLPDGVPVKAGYRVPNYVWSPDNQRLAFLSRVTKPVYSVDLLTYALGAQKAERAHAGVFGYGFLPKGDALIFRSNCIRQGRACDLFTLPLGPAPSGGAGVAAPAPKRLLEGIYTYELNADGSRALVSYARMEANRYDIALFDMHSGQQRTLDQGVQLPAFFVKEDGSRVVYVVDRGATPGVYAAAQAP